MNSLVIRRLGRLVPVLLLAATALVLVAPRSQAAPVPESGMLCETDPNNAFNLTAGDGYISTPDGNAIYMWGFAPTGSAFQFPGPVLCVTAGTTVTVVLHNSLSEPTSIMWPGQRGVTADGRPAQPEFDAAGTLTSLTDSAAARSGSVTYRFTAGSPGTYLYTTGTDVAKQNQMGLYGALVVRPVGHPDQVTDRADSAFNADHEYLSLLSEVDPDLHAAVERGLPFDYTKTRSRYFFINGRSMPDTLAPNRAAWLPSQPYGGLVHIQPYDPTSNPRPAVIRYLNAGSVNYPFHPHGNDERIVAQDGSAMAGPANQDLSLDKFLIDVTPGKTIDTLFTWKVEYDPAGNPLPQDISLPQLQDQIVGPGTDTWFSENPYLGGPKGPVPAGVQQNNQCGEFYHVAHSHALEQSTNFGATFGGMMTLIRIDPPTGCPAP